MNRTYSYRMAPALLIAAGCILLVNTGSGAPGQRAAQPFGTPKRKIQGPAVQGKPAFLTGTVRLNGKPVPGGTVRLNFSSGVVATGLDPNGAFAIGNLPTGKATVAIETQSVKTIPAPGIPGLKVPQELAKRWQEIDKTLPKNNVAFMAIPKKYARYETSGLKVELAPGRNHLNFKLVDR